VQITFTLRPLNQALKGKHTTRRRRLPPASAAMTRLTPVLSFRQKMGENESEEEDGR
jgi:hypothetical protein